MGELNIYTVGMIIIFVLGYIMIALEHITKINKATCALLMAILCWTLQFANEGFSAQDNMTFLGVHINNVSQVVFFLIGAVTIVEIIDSHKGFQVISESIRVNSKRKLLWLTGGLAFGLSAVLDNLTTTILMISLLRKLIDDGDDKLLIGGGIVIAANAGGAWTPIGDITTTMLWIGGQITSFGIMKALFIPSVVCVVAALSCLTFMLKGDFPMRIMHFEEKEKNTHKGLIFSLGIASLIFVPIFKALTGLPPFMGILFGLSVLWLVTDILYYKTPEKENLRVPSILSKVDLSAALFFLGILLCIDALETAGILERLARWLDHSIANVNIIAALIGLISAVIDNVPLVAACMGMYDLSQYPPDSQFWTLVAYAAGTGGSILVIGSAAGIAFMGLEKVDFVWYVKRISLAALVGYFAGMGAYLLG